MNAMVPASDSLRLTTAELRDAHAKGPRDCPICGKATYPYGGMHWTWSGRLHNYVCGGYSEKSQA